MRLIFNIVLLVIGNKLVDQIVIRDRIINKQISQIKVEQLKCENRMNGVKNGEQINKGKCFSILCKRNLMKEPKDRLNYKQYLILRNLKGIQI